MNTFASAIRPHERDPASADLAGDVRAGLAATPKYLPSKYFYDARGSELFEAICAQPEYYLTRSEIAILREHGPAIAAAIGPRVLLAEYGSGAGIKTRLLLRQVAQPVAYVPIEISRSALLASVAALAQEFPTLELLPVCADFTQPIQLPQPRRAPHRVAVYFPGSTIGNFERRQAVELLRGMHALTGAHGCALVGIDLKKDLAQIEAAYNDAAGVTAEFTLNLLTRLNRELDADFELAQFEHRARYNAVIGRIETYLVSRIDQHVQVNGERVHFAAGEAMLVEYSCKYAPHEFAWMAAKAGLRVAQSWTDADGRFALQLLEGAQDSRCASRKAGCAGQLEVE